jgi:hypothetical protein
MIIMINSAQDNTVHPPCPLCGHPGSSDTGSQPGICFYFCSSPKCTAPQKPHRWFGTTSVPGDD